MVQSPTLLVGHVMLPKVPSHKEGSVSVPGPVPAVNPTQLRPCCVGICLWCYAHAWDDVRTVNSRGRQNGWRSKPDKQERERVGITPIVVLLHTSP